MHIIYINIGKLVLNSVSGIRGKRKQEGLCSLFLCPVSVFLVITTRFSGILVFICDRIIFVCVRYFTV